MTMAAQPLHTPLRKRAHSPPTQGAFFSDDGDLIPTTSYHRDKRRRPNLANGFQGLSISIDQPQTYDSNLLEDDEGIGLGRSDTTDLKVEVLPEKEIRSHHHSNTHHWSIPNRAGPSSPSSSSTSTSSEGSSDVTFTRRHRGAPQQADEVVQPDQIEGQADLDVEDITVASPRRRRRDEEHGVGVRNKRARTGDVDMDGGDLRKTSWHEPEKDRIVITSLSDTSSSRDSRSASPEDDRYLSQPGMKGFTISPSLLTHLLKTQRDQFAVKDLPPNNSLVLYRPLGIAPGEWDDAIVKMWQTNDGYEDSGRFEELDDDEIVDDDSHMNVDDDGDVEMA
ncbi:hypothetical protein I302_108362 [Kwoniella bestiolae CBS 10118]|uniref:Uncharacterized protein n=1 Tax=Kwoniella bestiolae CBS 10118 TaxID=1296100 RepID=A0A1B9FVX2_9TREE|nr:hypothetical protein I302_07265 [Kwoniella bestiolae CBS 10118]OCF22915.1 hypothetical protein I302_07265 [Kwoniella bestiolae CBS 10118]